MSTRLDQVKPDKSYKAPEQHVQIIETLFGNGSSTEENVKQTQNSESNFKTKALSAIKLSAYAIVVYVIVNNPLIDKLIAGFVHNTYIAYAIKLLLFFIIMTITMYFVK